MGDLTLVNNDNTLMVNDNSLIESFKKNSVEMLSKLNQSPDNSIIKVNKHAQNAKYVPISYLEMKLDEMFYGMWRTRNFNTKVIANEIVGEITLEVFHPQNLMWLERIGAGAVMIQFSKDSDIRDIGNKIKNTLSKDYPHLKAECFRNACLSLGKAFGRDLNREFTTEYMPEEILNEDVFDKFFNTIEDFENEKELTAKAKNIIADAEKELSASDIKKLKKVINDKILSLRRKAA